MNGFRPARAVFVTRDLLCLTGSSEGRPSGPPGPVAWASVFGARDP